MLEIMSGEDRCTMINSAKIPCSGCLSCLNICPRDAISLAVDERGFSYPVVNQGKCIQCGLCEKACPCYTALENVPVHEIKDGEEYTRITMCGEKANLVVHSLRSLK